MASYFRNAGTRCCPECQEAPCDPCTAHVRFWNLQPFGANPATISGAGATFPNIPAGSYAGYSGEMPSGTYQITVVIGGQTFELDADFAGDGYYTIFIRQRSDGTLSVTILDDNWELGDPVRVRAHQLFFAVPGADFNHAPLAASAEFQLSGATVGSYGPLNYGQDALVTGLPVTAPPEYDEDGDDIQAISVVFTAVDVRGQYLSWNSALNTSVQRLFDVLILPDPYGRYRPRLVASGPDYFDENG